MAGTLTISTLSDGTNSTSATNPIMGSAKAWINYKGTATVSIRSSYNVSSVTVVGTGVYTINFTNAMANANYATVLGAGNNGNAFGISIASTSTSNVQINTRNTASALVVDSDLINVAILGS